MVCQYEEHINLRAFITPNMLDDGHDTTVNYAGNWIRDFLTPLLNDTKFNQEKTLIMITFDETQTYSSKNNVWALLLGSAIPPSLRGTIDSTFYTHYSCLSTLEANFQLYNLGRGDATPPFNNVFDFVASTTNWTNVEVTADQIPYNNFTASGYFDTKNPAPIPAVITNYTGPGGKGLLPSLQDMTAIPPNSTPTNATGSSASRSLGAGAVGGIVGGILGGLLLVAVIIIIYMSRRNRRGQTRPDGDQQVLGGAQMNPPANGQVSEPAETNYRGRLRYPKVVTDISGGGVNYGTENTEFEGARTQS